MCPLTSATGTASGGHREGEDTTDRHLCGPHGPAAAARSTTATPAAFTDRQENCVPKSDSEVIHGAMTGSGVEST